MASIVRGRGNSWEVRESVRTHRGPRSRTLATFRQLDEDAIDLALSRASVLLTAEDLVANANRAGAPVGMNQADEAAATLMREFAYGRKPRYALRRLLQATFDELPGGTGDVGSAVEWVGASLEQRAKTLEDLLLLTDSMPIKRRGRLTFPRLTSS